jgi:hypothetical protein
MILVVSASNVDETVKLLQNHEFDVYSIGHIMEKIDANAKNVVLQNLDICLKRENK